MFALLLASCILSTAALADVFYEEEIVNKGLGARKTGARKTTNRVYIKKQRQLVRSAIETSKTGAKALRRLGQALDGSTILQLDRANLYQIDNTKQTFTQQRLPAAKRAAPMPGMPTYGAAKAAASKADSDRSLTFRTRTLPDTTRVAGILCRRVAAEMRARHYRPGTKKVRRENRYLYQAWVADGFEGYRDIKKFQDLQAQRTSYPSLIRGGLGANANAIADYDSLRHKIEALEGFHMQSVLEVFTKEGQKKEQQIFELVRTVKSLTYSPLPDSLFDVSEGLTRARQ